jgi:hypothetical protein
MSYELPADPGIDESAREVTSGPVRDLPEQEGDCICPVGRCSRSSQPLQRRKIRLIECNAKCRYLRKLTCKGTLQHVFYLSEAPT